MPPAIQELLHKVLSKKRKKFPESLKSFACTLHFHSPAAYMYVRKMFVKCLPHPTTLRTWMRTVHCNSDISDLALQNVVKKVKNAREKNKNLIFNITFDEMHIKKKVDWDGKKIHGFIDTDVKVDNNSLSLASQVLLFMLICIIVPYFSHPIDKSKRIYIFYDACHMLKLMRNAISKENITDKDGNIISWTFLKELVNLQNVEKLHVANKIRKRHVQFFNEKMKVNLAAQTLSNLVADALTFLEYDLKESKFSGASATAKFCKHFDDIFDILNSRNIYNKTENKRAITRDTLYPIKDKATHFINYIDSLQIKNVSILQSTLKTGFIGFIINLRNVALAEELFYVNVIDFLLTYKLSQDHVETYFSLIRRMHGWNNNPSAKQFKESYRKILHLANVSVSLSANCIPKDDTVLLKVSNTSTNDVQGIEEHVEMQMLIYEKNFQIPSLLNIIIL
ncbi:THAP domain-containing protein [Ooceraea biroi]|uniref:THAP domain-containing protein n=1 Tax=Ooceraea biroi TaxID=2015173 RepID=A0A026W369_OOCBI|nr:THAP domain-containing protein [Ooceraea biroi]